jgi:hypothetical protein
VKSKPVSTFEKNKIVFEEQNLLETLEKLNAEKRGSVKTKGKFKDDLKPDTTKITDRVWF